MEFIILIIDLFWLRFLITCCFCYDEIRVKLFFSTWHSILLKYKHKYQIKYTFPMQIIRLSYTIPIYYYYKNNIFPRYEEGVFDNTLYYYDLNWKSHTSAPILQECGFEKYVGNSWVLLKGMVWMFDGLSSQLLWQIKKNAQNGYHPSTHQLSSWVPTCKSRHHVSSFICLLLSYVGMYKVWHIFFGKCFFKATILIITRKCYLLIQLKPSNHYCYQNDYYICTRIKKLKNGEFESTKKTTC